MYVGGGEGIAMIVVEGGKVDVKEGISFQLW